jgi:hypothetical protein
VTPSIAHEMPCDARFALVRRCYDPAMSLPRVRVPSFVLAAILSTSSIVVGPIVAPRIAHAEPSAADRETARGLMAEGRDKRDKGDAKGALEAFRAAHRIMGVPTTGLEVGRTEADLGLLIEARDTLLSVTRLAPKPGEPAPFAAARAEAEQLADALAPRIPAAKIVLRGAPEGAETEIAFDGTAAGAVLGVPRKMNPGAHVVVVKIGTVSERAEFVLAEGQTKEVVLDFSAHREEFERAPPPIRSDAGSGGSSGIGPVAIAGFAVAGVGLVAGTVTGLMHLSKTSDLEGRCPAGRCGPETDADYNSARNLSTLSTLSFAVAGAGAVVGLVGLFTRPSEGDRGPKTSRARETPSMTWWVGLGSAGVAGRF